MAARSIGSATIRLGLVAVPVKLYTAQSAKAVSFSQLHKCGARTKQQLVCSLSSKVVPREELVKGFEFAPEQFVVFSAKDMQALESTQAGAIEITETVPVDSVQALDVEKSYYLGPDKGGDRGFHLLATALEIKFLAAIGSFAKRGKDTLVAIRSHRGGLLLHECLYAEEVRPLEEVELGARIVPSDRELHLAGQLLRKMHRDAFDASRFHDSWAKRVREAVERKIAGDEFVTPPKLPGGQVLDLEEALRASLKPLAKTREAKPPRRKTATARA